jgi:hypothetical protein
MKKEKKRTGTKSGWQAKDSWQLAVGSWQKEKKRGNEKTWKRRNEETKKMKRRKKRITRNHPAVRNHKPAVEIDQSAVRNIWDRVSTGCPPLNGFKV